MNTLEKFKEELKNIEREISDMVISDELYRLMALFNRRVLIGNKIAKYNWDQLDLIEKEKKREADFNKTKQFFEKFQDELANKYNYKKEYINFYKEVKRLYLLDSSNRKFYEIILKVLNTKDYINIMEQVCICSIIEQIQLEETIESKDLVNIFNKISQIPYELK